MSSSFAPSDKNITVMDGKKYEVSKEEREKLLLMKKKKKEFDYMTSSVLMEKQKHLLASLHLKAIFDHLLFVPSIGITLVTGILAVLGQSDIYNSYHQNIFNMSIAILAAFSVFWQSLVKQLDYGGRASLHNSAAVALGKIYKISTLQSRRQKFTARDDDLDDRTKNKEQTHDGSTDGEQARGLAGRERPPDGYTALEHVEEGIPVVRGETNQDGGGNYPEEEENVHVAPMNSSESQVRGGEDHISLSKQIDQALEGCTSVVPIKITCAFNTLESRINVCNKRLIASANDKPSIAWEKVYPALYHQLTLTIIGTKLWPYVVPDAEWAVNKTINDFQSHNGDLLKFLIDRAHVIEDEYSTLMTTETAPLVSAQSSH
mmetsp:Transcript_13726/g.29846  ORF Transcript_13726/g.29846 Transcript_13726/m.29846 type:complete len:375 (-) Transcript_13726:186-1310(-)